MIAIGDRVRITSCKYNAAVVGAQGTVSQTAGRSFLINFDRPVRESFRVLNDWWVGEVTKVERIDAMTKDTTITLGVPNSIADDLRLKPQARKILGHLKKGLSISPLEAQTVYSVWRLAASIRELRQAGYKITTEMKHDEAGHKYARYWLTNA